MKLRQAMCCALFFCHLNTYAQNTPPYWSLAANSGTNGTGKLGTYDSADLNLITNNQARLGISAEGKVAIGLSPVSPTYGRLQIAGNGNLDAVDILGTPNWGIRTHGEICGIDASGLGSGGSASWGIRAGGTYAGVDAAGTKYGLIAYGNLNSVFGYTTSYGNAIRGQAESGAAIFGSTSSYGMGAYFISQKGYGVVARTYSSNGLWAGVFYGQVYTNGNYQTSDRRLKKNISEFRNATSMLNRLKPKIYEFSQEGKLAAFGLPGGKHYGLIAQDVESVFPSLVAEVLEDAKPSENQTMARKEESMDKGTFASTPTTLVAEGDRAPVSQDKIKVLNYTELIPILVKALQEQDAEKEELKQKVQKLESRLQKLEAR